LIRQGDGEVLEITDHKRRKNDPFVAMVATRNAIYAVYAQVEKPFAGPIYAIKTN